MRAITEFLEISAPRIHADLIKKIEIQIVLLDSVPPTLTSELRQK
jgi:hypothetical protein